MTKTKLVSIAVAAGLVFVALFATLVMMRGLFYAVSAVVLFVVWELSSKWKKSRTKQH